MAVNQNKKKLQENFADYIKTNIKKPEDWNIELFGKFPPRKTGLKNYFSFLIEENKQKEKLFSIHEFFNFEEQKQASEKIEKLNALSGRLKSIENLFADKSTPVERTLNFIAVIFDLPIKNITAFEAERKKIKSKPETETETNKTKSKTVKKISEERDVVKIEDKRVKKTLKRRIVVFCSLLIFLIVCGFTYKVSVNYFSLYSRFNKAKDKLNEIEKLSFKPLFLNDEIFETDSLNTSETEKITSSKGSEDIEIEFYTNNIYNHKFLYSSKQWSFETDTKGEDINSDYGKPFFEELKSLYPYPKNFATLANDYIWIRFNIQNKSSTPVFVDNLNIKILSVVKINKTSVHYNEWTTALPNEMKYEFVLNNKAKNYPGAIENKKLRSDNPLHFSFKVRGDKSCDNQIFKFRILISCNDGKGNRFTVKSDKDYFIGFLYPYQLIK